MDKYPFSMSMSDEGNGGKHIKLLESMLCLYKKIQYILLINLNDIFKKDNVKLLLDDIFVRDTIEVLKANSFNFNALLQVNDTNKDDKENENLYVKYTTLLHLYVNDPIIYDYSNKKFKDEDKDKVIGNSNHNSNSIKNHNTIIQSNSTNNTVNTVKTKKGCFKQKKDHEVEQLSQFIHYIGKKENTQVYLEMGCGKSYLTANLMENNSTSLYIGIDMKEDLIANSTKQNLTKDNIIVLSSLITVSNFNSFFTNTICPLIKAKNKQVDHILLFGLHSCGNLTSDTLKFFVKYPNFSTLAIVGCCLNLLKEYISPEAKESQIFKTYYQGIGYDSKGNFLEQTLLYGEYSDAEVGYPLSQYIKLNHKEMFLSRTIRNSSMQKSTESHMITSVQCKKIFYRTLLQAFLEEYIPELSLSYGFKKVELNDKETFSEYIMKILDTLEPSKVKGIKDKDKGFIEELYIKYADKEQILWAVYMIRMKFGKLVEYIIALDRAIYLNENGISNVQLIKIFNENVSIRNIMIYASKNNNK